LIFFTASPARNDLARLPREFLASGQAARRAGMKPKKSNSALAEKRAKESTMAAFSFALQFFWRNE